MAFGQNCLTSNLQALPESYVHSRGGWCPCLATAGWSKQLDFPVRVLTVRKGQISNLMRSMVPKKIGMLPRCAHPVGKAIRWHKLRVELQPGHHGGARGHSALQHMLCHVSWGI